MDAASILSSELDEFFDAPETRSLFNTPTAIRTRLIPNAQESILNRRPSRSSVRFRLPFFSSSPAYCLSSHCLQCLQLLRRLQSYSQLPRRLQLPRCLRSPRCLQSCSQLPCCSQLCHRLQLLRRSRLPRRGVQ